MGIVNLCPLVSVTLVWLLCSSLRRKIVVLLSLSHRYGHSVLIKFKDTCSSSLLCQTGMVTVLLSRRKIVVLLSAYSDMGTMFLITYMEIVVSCVYHAGNGHSVLYHIKRW